jgi:O-succinylbenzoate synthase
MRNGIIFKSDRGWGEAAPLPGYSGENIDDAIASIDQHQPAPSVHFGLVCARSAMPLSFPPIFVSALAAKRDDIEKALNAGFRTIKIKIRDMSVREALDLIQAIQSPCVRLRIDVNRRWDIEEAQFFFHHLDPTGIEYIEEPIRNPAHLSRLTHLPIALDESLLDAQNLTISRPNISALILKPTLLGRRLKPLIEWGQRHQKKLIFSSCFESAIALLHIAHLQAEYSPECAAGLDTHRFFKNNFFPMSIKNGMLSNEPLPELDRRWLREYAP